MHTNCSVAWQPVLKNSEITIATTRSWAKRLTIVVLMVFHIFAESGPGQLRDNPRQSSRINVERYEEQQHSMTEAAAYSILFKTLSVFIEKSQPPKLLAAYLDHVGVSSGRDQDQVKRATQMFVNEAHNPTRSRIAEAIEAEKCKSFLFGGLSAPGRIAVARYVATAIEVK